MNECDKCNYLNHKIEPIYSEKSGQKRTHCRCCGELLVEKTNNYYIEEVCKINEPFKCEWRLIDNYKTLLVDIEKIYYFNELPIKKIEKQALYITNGKFSKWAEIVK